MKKDIKQFKLTNGDEVVCEVVQWPEEDSDDIIVRNAIQLIPKMGMPGGGKYYVTIAPWMTLQDDPDLFQIIFAQHVISEATPTEDLLEQYYIAIDDDKPEKDDYIAQLRSDLTEQLANALANLGDSGDGSKIINFPGKGKLH